ncbi:MAG: DUF3667 domain-containing protein [Planctomycetaceae bacterium]|nr:DUF3667 domain-containing protein [Planctomycetaceae bacterium]
MTGETTTDSKTDSPVARKNETPGDAFGTSLPAPERLSFAYLLRQALETLNLERGIGFTVWRWLVMPHQASQEFLFHDRVRYVKPFTFLALSVTLVTFVSLQIFEAEVKLEAAAPQMSQLPEKYRSSFRLALTLVIQYLHVFLVIALPFQAFVNGFVFRKTKWFYPEHLVVLAYLNSTQLLINASLVPLFLVNETIFSIVTSFAAPLYLLFSFWRVYEARWWLAAIGLLCHIMIGSIVPGLVVGLLFVVIHFGGFAG